MADGYSIPAHDQVDRRRHGGRRLGVGPGESALGGSPTTGCSSQGRRCPVRPFNGSSLVGKARGAVVLDAVVPVLQRRGTQRQPGGGGQSERVDVRRLSRRAPTSRPWRGFVSKYNLNFTTLNDADGSIWARYNVPVAAGVCVLPRRRIVDVREQPDFGDAHAGAVRPGSRALS